MENKEDFNLENDQKLMFERKVELAKTTQINNEINMAFVHLGDIELLLKGHAKEDIILIRDKARQLINMWRKFRKDHRL